MAGKSYLVPALVGLAGALWAAVAIGAEEQTVPIGGDIEFGGLVASVRSVASLSKEPLDFAPDWRS